MSTASSTRKPARPSSKSGHEQTELRLVVSPAFDGRGRRRHEQFEARLSGDVLCVSRQPLLDAARALLNRGMDPSTVLAKVHADNPSVVTLKSPVGVAATLDVMGTRFVLRKTHLGPMPGPVAHSGYTRVPDQAESERRAVEASDNVEAVEAGRHREGTIALASNAGGHACGKFALT
jgi:hypothetical protein